MHWRHLGQRCPNYVHASTRCSGRQKPHRIRREPLDSRFQGFVAKSAGWPGALYCTVCHGIANARLGLVQIVFLCPFGSYGLLGETCIDCVVRDRRNLFHECLPLAPPADLQTSLAGAVCPGGETTNDLVVASPGWWRFNVSGSSTACAGRSGRATTCPSVVPCLPSTACLGANVCDKQYAGVRCSSCASGFYRNNGSCIPCPSSPWAIIVGFLLIASFGTGAGAFSSQTIVIPAWNMPNFRVGATSAAYLLHKYNVSLVLITIGAYWLPYDSFLVLRRLCVSRTWQVLTTSRLYPYSLVYRSSGVYQSSRCGGCCYGMEKLCI